MATTSATREDRFFEIRPPAESISFGPSDAVNTPVRRHDVRSCTYDTRISADSLRKPMIWRCSCGYEAISLIDLVQHGIEAESPRSRR